MVAEPVVREIHGEDKMFGETNASSSSIQSKVLLDIENVPKDEDFSMGESFNGKEKDWEGWKFTAVAMFSIQGLGPLLQ